MTKVLNEVVGLQMETVWQRFWKHELWTVLIKICNFRKLLDTPDKGKFIFLDDDPKQQGHALAFFRLIRKYIVAWDSAFGTVKGRETQFKSGYYQVYGGLEPPQPTSRKRFKKLRLRKSSHLLRPVKYTQMN